LVKAQVHQTKLQYLESQKINLRSFKTVTRVRTHLLALETTKSFLSSETKQKVFQNLSLEMQTMTKVAGLDQLKDLEY
jgi:hypothetical protein